MLIIRLLLLAFVPVVCYSSALAQVTFDRDSVSIRYARCAGESSATPVAIINHSNQSVELDLRFADSSISWYFVADGVEARSLEDRALAAGDTLQLLLLQDWGPTISIDTLIVEGAAFSDTLTISSEIVRPLLSYPGRIQSFGVLGAGSTKSLTLPITNVSEVYFAVNSVSLADTEWTLSGISKGDTIMPGETRNVVITFNPQTRIRSYNGTLYINSSCGQVAFSFDAKVVAPGVHWAQTVLVDTVRGCARPTNYTVNVTNSGSTNLMFDSIGFTKGYDYLWSVVGSPKSITISPGSTFPVVFRREALGGFSFVVLYPSVGKPDTIPVRIYMETARPELKNTRDTVIFNRTTDQPVTYVGILENEGEVPYRLTSMSYTGSDLWKIEMPDTVTELAKNRFTEIRARFDGTSMPGDYAVTYQVQGTVCDTVLTQTLIARVTMADVKQSAEKQTVTLYPAVATTGITLHSNGETEYTIVDILGNEVRKGAIDAAETRIDVSSLSQGRYFLRAITGDAVTALAFSVVR